MNKSFPNLARNSFIAFCAFATIIIAFRHVRSDHEQDQRIEQLEIQLLQFEKKQEQLGKLLIESRSLKPQDPAILSNSLTLEKSPRNSFQTKSNRKDIRGRALLQNENIETDTVAVKISTSQKNINSDIRKFTSPVKLELNVIDSVTLIRVPGIASKTASTILRYREQLGGFFSPEQLREKLTWESAQDRMDEWCNDWFTADESLIRVIAINKLSFSELLKHPYFNYNQVKAVVRYRDRYKHIDSISQLEQLGCFDEATIEKLKHYCSFE